MASAETQKSPCPICHRTDQVKKLPAAYEGGMQQFAPPPMPVKQVSMMNNIFIGVIFVGLCLFFVIVLIGSGMFGENFSYVEFGLVILTLISIVTALLLSALAFQKVIRGDAESQKLLPLWDEAMEKWRSLYYCSRDNAVFDPATNKTLTKEALASMIAVGHSQATAEKSASLAH